MGDMGDAFREHREYMKERKAREGVNCPGCRKVQPKRIPSRLLPGWTCKVCGYTRPRKSETPNAANQARNDSRIACICLVGFPSRRKGK